MLLQKVISKKTLNTKKNFVAALKITDENSRSRIWIRLSEVRICSTAVFKVLLRVHCSQKVTHSLKMTSLKCDLFVSLGLKRVIKKYNMVPTLLRYPKHE